MKHKTKGGKRGSAQHRAKRASKHVRKRVKAGHKKHSAGQKPKSGRKKAHAARAVRKAVKLRKPVAVVQPEVNKEYVEQISRALSQPGFSGYMTKNVGVSSADILKLLVNGSQTDEEIAAKLNIKINEVRRMLNVMNGYSILRYDINKDSKGWLIFKWRIDAEKILEFEKSINRSIVDGGSLSSSCNDFFFCGSCYNDNRVVVPFDAAFETSFKCDNCGKSLNMLGKEETRALFKA